MNKLEEAPTIHELMDILQRLETRIDELMMGTLCTLPLSRTYLYNRFMQTDAHRTVS